MPTTGVEHSPVEDTSKEGSTLVELVNGTSPPTETAFDEKATRKLIRKLDWMILPFLSLLYLLSFLDRTNIGNARLAGLEKGLNMKGLQYNVCTTNRTSKSSMLIIL
jgi:hypothetical protein